MTPDPNSPKGDLSDQPEATIEAFATLFNKGMARMVRAQKAALAAAAQQNAEAVETLKQHAPWAPGLSLFDLAKQAFDSYVETQKSLLEMIEEQSSSIFEAAKTRRSAAANIASDTAELLQESLDRTVSAQKSALEFTAQQNKTAMETLKQQFGVSGTPVELAADSIERGMDVLIETQKNLLDIASKSFKSATRR